MKKIVLTLLYFFSVSFLIAQNVNEEFKGVILGNSGWNDLTSGKYNSSIKKSRKALALDPSLSTFHFNMALAYLLKGENKVALQEYKSAIERAKRFGVPHKKFKSAIDDIVTYQEAITSQSIANEIIQRIEDTAKDYLKVTTLFQHVPNTTDSLNLNTELNHWGDIRLDGVKMTTLDDSGNLIWTSEKITDFVKDSLDLLIKIEIPQLVLLKSKKMECLYFYSTTVHKKGGAQSIETRYSSENQRSNFPNIKLNLHSSPSGAEIFLVPNRFWIKNFEGKNWQSFKESSFDRFRINGATTNAFTQIDETVYVVIFKHNGIFKTRTFYTQPAQVQPEQTVMITF
jgi:tetratricopeptide (TPR) repeat protein